MRDVRGGRKKCPGFKIKGGTRKRQSTAGGSFSVQRHRPVPVGSQSRLINEVFCPSGKGLSHTPWSWSGLGRGSAHAGVEGGSGLVLPPAPGAHFGEKREKTVAGAGSWNPYPHFHPIKKQGETSVSPIPSAGAAGEGEPSIFSSLKAPTRVLQRSRSTWMKQHPSEFANAARRLWNASNVFSPFPLHMIAASSPPHLIYLSRPSDAPVMGVI